MLDPEKMPSPDTPTVLGLGIATDGANGDLHETLHPEEEQEGSNLQNEHEQGDEEQD